MHDRPRLMWRLASLVACVLALPGLFSACVSHTIACGHRVAEVSASNRTTGHWEFVRVEPDGSVVARNDGREVRLSVEGHGKLRVVASDYANQTATIVVPWSTRWSSFLWFEWDVRDDSEAPVSSGASSEETPAKGS